MLAEKKKISLDMFQHSLDTAAPHSKEIEHPPEKKRKRKK